MKSLKLLLRFLTVGGLVLLLLIPLMMIRGTIQERESYRLQAVERVVEGTAGKQRLTGPIRVVPWTETRRSEWVDDKGVKRQREEKTSGHLLQMPKTLAVSGRMNPDERKVGLYKVRVYEWQADLQATFDPALPGASAKDAERQYGVPYLVFGVSDVRGVVGAPDLKVDGATIPLQSGTGYLGARMDGIHADLPAISDGRVAGDRIAMKLTLKGTESLSVVPLADNNQIRIDSAWPHPKFEGYSPASDVTSTGFTANWKISSLASNAQKQLRGEDGGSSQADRIVEGRVLAAPLNGSVDALHVSLVDPIDVYTQADRASKYGILFVVLTFVGFALFELIKRLPIHPLQYLLVGLALAIFFLLLLSLSEHIAFWQAYLVSAVACIGLQFVYLSGVLKSWARAAGFATMLTMLYGVLYGLLVSEDNALLMGSLLLFGILAAIMWVTRKVDWYGLGTELR
ncbi:cell envelope integrity protein CreD [Pseudoxanthomonas sp. PXM02]|uniref:cell envelope integrity protein CreD n=1 Tax=Pseudoxanthomonas sp. PXM02 TaxID=2769294 RepID=UPI0017854DAE|nr:cell envelope integrity protein CreD [Pseudoxanthomonas sp. PXM02]MBD9477992.1 cell envelope integrity protein CreD [Pseudoxanthomonas sp. PXM02]